MILKLKGKISDIKTAFLHGDMDSEVYVKPPKGVSLCKDGVVLRLNKGLYGLKQASRLWYQKFCEVMSKLKFEQCKSAECLFYRRTGNGELWILLYVDDIVVAGTSLELLSLVKQELGNYVQIKDLGPVHQFLGVSVLRDADRLCLSQEHFINQLLNRFEMSKCNPAPTPMADCSLADHVEYVKDRRSLQDSNHA